MIDQSSGKNDEWILTLLPILKQALDDLGYERERDPKQFRKCEQGQKDASTSMIEGSERRRQRPKEAKALHYSDKTETEKANNRKISRVRVRVEHAIAGIKHSRGVKDILRNTKDVFRIWLW